MNQRCESLTRESFLQQKVTKGARHKIVISIQKLKDRQNLLRSLEKVSVSLRKMFDSGRLLDFGCFAFECRSLGVELVALLATAGLFLCVYGRVWV